MHRNAESRLPNAFLSKPDADAKALRAFWRGVVVGAAGLEITHWLAAWWW